jgi:SAM-dependent methyltransferase
MHKPTVTEDDMRRLRAERQDADRAYNQALTAVDAALAKPFVPPAPPVPPDDTKVAPLNELWAIVPAEPPFGGRGWRARLSGFIWRLVGPMLQRQQLFNAALVEHVNRTVASERAAREAVAAMLGSMHHDMDVLAAFQSHLIRYLQQVTPYVDTKDRQAAGEVRLITDMLDRRTIALSAGLTGLGDELLKRWESAVAREQRFDTRVTSLAGAFERDIAEFRATLAVLQRSSVALKREVERVIAGQAVASAGLMGAGSAPTAVAGADIAAVARAGAVEAGATPVALVRPDVTEEALPASSATLDVSPGSSQLAGSPLDAYKYVGFEDTFRGAADDIRARLTEYLPLFEGTSGVVDLGCGRGEFLELLRERGIAARGVDINHEMVETCRSRGLSVDEGDGLVWLERQPDSSIGGLFAAQVVEHLQPDQLLRLVDLASRKLTVGGRILLETINPACWYAFFESYIRDITHVRPIHPDTLTYFLRASGFQRVEVRYRAPYPERGKLQSIPIPVAAREDASAIHPLADLAETFNANAEKINRLLFTYLDYAVIGERA